MNKAYAEVQTPFKFEYLERMAIRDREARYIKENPALYQGLAALGDGGIFRYDKIILAAAGFYRLWGGAYEVWVIPTVFVHHYPFVFLRTVRRYCDLLLETHPVERLQSPAHADPQTDKWMRFLGFTNETPTGMPKYVNGEMYNMWARYKA